MKKRSLENKKIGIVGVGMVGGALLHYFQSQGIIPLLHDPYKKLGSQEELNRADIVFVCVPTPFEKEKGFDMSYVEKSLKLLSPRKAIVIKSTVIPGTTERLQIDYPQHTFFFSPEFLVEEKAIEDMMHPERQIVGFTSSNEHEAQQILDLLPSAPFTKIIPSTEAEMVKYFGNTFLAMKVIFANQMYELCKKLDIDYDLVKDCVSTDKRIGASHLDVRHGGYHGYGGKCLPKDIRALIQFAESVGIDLELHKTVDTLNNNLMEQQGIEDPEQFSKRD